MLPSQSEEMYQLKTMCLSKRAVKMPNKEEHGNLLFYGLGTVNYQFRLIRPRLANTNITNNPFLIRFTAFALLSSVEIANLS